MIDEVPAVGDLRFQAMCREKLDEVKKRQVIIVLVSHSLGEVRGFCERVIWLNIGRIAADGEPGVVIPLYEEAMF